MTENETYQVTAECGNCGHIPKEITTNGTVLGPLEYAIPKGTPALTFLMDEQCPNCGCRGCLKRRL